jgi:Porin subfamily
MQKFFLTILGVLWASAAFAESSRPLKLDTPANTDKPASLKGKASSSSCAAYGPGFVKIEGTDTCVQIGGSISVGAGVRR